MIVFENVSVKYGKFVAVRGFSGEFRDKAITCVLGPNASGKTSILRAVMRIADYEGRILLDGDDIAELTRSELARRISLVMPPSSPPLLGIKVIDYLAYARYPISTAFFENEETLGAINEVARLLNISDLLTRELNELSSGELQRVLIAAGILKRPRYLLLDEPDSHTDIGYKPFLINLLRELRGQFTIALTTHDLLFASLVCDDVILLSRGVVAFSGHIDELFSDKGVDVLEKTYGVKLGKISLGDRDVLIPIYSRQSLLNATSTAASEATGL